MPTAALKSAERNYLNNIANAELLIEFEWKRFFTAYSMAFNRQHGRNGNLFNRPFKRKEVIKDSHFTQAIIYIHANAQKHKLCRHFTEHS